MDAVTNPNGVVEVVEVTRKLAITRDMIETVLVNGIEGGIAYWCSCIETELKDGTQMRAGKTKDTPLSVWITELVLDGKEVGFNDGDDITYLHIDRLVSSFKEHATTHSRDIEDYDADDADAIIQRALYGSVVFG